MKSRTLTSITAMTLFAGLVIPTQLAAQRTRYKLIDIGTFGGPNSNVQVAGNLPSVLNNQGTVAGCADTSTSNPNFPNFNPLLQPPAPDPFVFHTFQWQRGALIDLGALPGVNSSCAFWISGNGLIAGTSEVGVIDPLTGWPEAHATLWKHAEIIDLGTLGGNESEGFAVNNRGQVIGTALNAVPESNGFGTELRAFFWQKGAMQDLGTLGGNDAQAFGINESGQITGVSYRASLQGSDPFLWERGKMINLGSLGGTFGNGGLINNRGQIMGQSNLAGDQVLHAFLWDRGVLTDLGGFGGDTVEAFGLNDLGEVVGGSTYPGNTFGHAFLWHNGVISDLGSLYPTCEPASSSTAFGVNSKTQVVGWSFCNNVAAAAILWEKGGPMVDLNTLVPPNSGMQLVIAFNINERGEIGGIGVLANGDQHAFILIPCGQGTEGCGNDAASSTATRRSNSPLTMAQRFTIGRMILSSRTRLSQRYHIPGQLMPRD